MYVDLYEHMEFKIFRLFVFLFLNFTTVTGTSTGTVPRYFIFLQYFCTKYLLVLIVKIPKDTGIYFLFDN